MNKKRLSLIIAILISAAIFIGARPASADSMQFTSPIGGETWGQGTTHTITWTISSSDPSPLCAVDLFSNGAASASDTIVADFTDKSYSWPIPNNFIAQYGEGKYKFSLRCYNHIALGTTYAESNYIYIVANPNGSPDLAITDLTADENPSDTKKIDISFAIQNLGTKSVFTPTTYNITSAGAITTFVGNDGCAASAALEPGNSCFVYGTITYDSLGEKLINVAADPNNTIPELNETNNLAQISFPLMRYIKITYPNGGEQWKAGESHAISWQADLAHPKCAIDLFEKGNTSPVKSNIVANFSANPNNYTTSYDWIVPNDLNGGNYKFMARCTNEGGNALYIDQSDSYFNIANKAVAATPWIKLGDPNGGEEWPVGSERLITWDSSESIKGILLYLTNEIGAVVATNLVNASGNRGVASWTIDTSIAPGKYKILIHGCSAINCSVNNVVSASTSIANDMSDAAFSIINAPTVQPSIKVISPNGGEKWELGKQYNIKWTAVGLTDKSRYGYIILDKVGTSGINIAGGVSGDYDLSLGEFTWIVKNDLTPNNQTGDDFSITVASRDSTYTAYDTSDITFSIIDAIGSAPISFCLPNGTLLKAAGDPKIYLIANCQKKWIQTAVEFKQAGYKWENVKESTSLALKNYPDYQIAVGLLKGIGQEKVYKIVGNKKIWIPTAEAFNAQGLKWSDIKKVANAEVEKYQTAKLLQSNNDKKVYYITNSGLKRHVPSVEVFNSYGNKWKDVVEVSDADINLYPDVNLIKAQDGSKVYKLEDGKKRWIKTASAFERSGYDWNKVAPINNAEFTAYPEAAPIE